MFRVDPLVLYQPQNGESEDCKHVDGQEDDEEEEEWVIPVPHSVVDVRTMVVKPLHAHVADISMPTPWRPDDLAVRTDVVSISIV